MYCIACNLTELEHSLEAAAMHFEASASHEVCCSESTAWLSSRKCLSLEVCLAIGCVTEHKQESPRLLPGAAWRVQSTGAERLVLLALLSVLTLS